MSKIGNKNNGKTTTNAITKKRREKRRKKKWNRNKKNLQWHKYKWQLFVVPHHYEFYTDRYSNAVVFPAKEFMWCRFCMRQRRRRRQWQWRRRRRWPPINYAHQFIWIEYFLGGMCAVELLCKSDQISHKILSTLIGAGWCYHSSPVAPDEIEIWIVQIIYYQPFRIFK